MRNILPVPIALLLLLAIRVISYGSYTGKGQTQVSASVGQYTLSVAGFISPYANIILTTPDGVFLRSTVADSTGNFSISGVLIAKGFSGFCLEAIDFKRIGQSTTCFNTAPAQSSIVMKNLFLPPTLGLYRSRIAAGSSALAFGYTMPYAVVTLHLSNGDVITISADGTGYYTINIKGLKAGIYKLFSLAEYKQKLSLSPTKAIELRALSLIEQIIAFLKDLWERIIRFFTSIGLGPLWFGLPLIILIIILILKLWPEKFTFVYERRLSGFFNPHSKRLHHWWFVGF